VFDSVVEKVAESDSPVTVKTFPLLELSRRLIGFCNWSIGIDCSK
jgi:hypothetical protein